MYIPTIVSNMAIFTVLAKFLSLEYYYNTKIAGLAKILSHDKYLAIQYSNESTGKVMMIYHIAEVCAICTVVFMIVSIT